MPAIAHTFAYFRGLPLLGSNITAEGGTALTTCRVVGPITEDTEHRINLEDVNESGVLVGELHDDLTTHINLTVKFPTGFTPPTLNKIVTLAGATGLAARYNGVWKLAKAPIEFKSGEECAEMKLELVKHAGITYAAQ